MREIALHLLDLVQNSIQAGAELVSIHLTMDGDGLLKITIEDDGKGMDGETLERALSPFGTSRTTRKVGLGIPMTQDRALGTGGSFEVSSTLGKGTRVCAGFNTRHIDCPPVGNLRDTLLSLILANPDRPDFTLHLESPAAKEALDTRQIKQVLHPIPINTPDAAQWLSDTIQEMAEKTLGGDGV
jgi:signal transduction histidine kinase